MMRPVNTDRGFARYEFIDFYGVHCSLQKSSMAMLDAVWLGPDADQVEPFQGTYVNTRMHLTREMAQALIPMLQHFVDTGELPS